MDLFWRDIGLAFRSLRKGGGVTAAAVLTLAIGIGGTAAIFGIVDAVLLRPLPYKNSERLVSITDNFPKQNLLKIWVSVPEYEDYRTQNRSFEQIGAHIVTNANVTGLLQPERVQIAFVTASFFNVLGVAPALGRSFEPDEDEEGRSNVVLLSHAFWKTRFSGDPNVTRGTVVLNGTPCSVIGVMPASFSFPRDTDIWRPIGFNANLRNQSQRSSRFLRVIAKLKPGVTVGQGQTDMDLIAAKLRSDYPSNYSESGHWTITVSSLTEDIVGGARTALLVLLAAVAFVLLIACGNVANLLLARAIARQKEMTIRAALGATRRRVIGQLLTESLVLGLIGGAAGLLLAAWGMDVLVAIAPSSLPRTSEIRMDWRVIAVTFGVSLLTGLLFGIAPALHAAKAELHQAMGSGVRTSSSAMGRLRSILVVTQVALAVLLLTGAGLMIRSFVQLTRVDPGFQPKGVLAARISLPKLKYPTDDKTAGFYQQLISRLRTVPGLTFAAATSILPLTGRSDWSFDIENRTIAPGEVWPDCEYRVVTSDYFRALGVHLLAGRFLTEADTDRAPAVAVVNQAFARFYFPTEDTVGKRIRIHGKTRSGDPLPWATVIGVVSNTRDWGIESEPLPAMYFSALQRPDTSMGILLRTGGNPAALASSLRAEVNSLDSELPVFSVEPFEKLVERSLGQRRFSTFVLTLFAALAVSLAALGIYGVMFYSVSQRTGELGIRMALGAEGPAVMRLVLAQGLRLVLVGIAVGVAGGLALTRLMSSLLYGVAATDAWTFLAVSFFFASIALLATAIPAWRATVVSPMTALRAE